MNDYSLQAHLDSIYSSFPETKRKPVIGITANYGDNMATLNEPYFLQVVKAGAVPVLIPPVADPDVIASTLDRIDGLLLTGGADINPLWAGEEPEAGLGNINAARDLPELLITRLAYNRQMPILGICRGIQTLAVALGGTVIQDIKSKLKHSQQAARNERTHTVRVEKGYTLYNIYNKEQLAVNSFHHQAVADTGEKFIVTATAPDGIIEAMESSEHKPILGVQWHPECMEEEGGKIFEWLVGEAKLFGSARLLHHKFLTIDTHCDTPMFFHQGADFSKRDDKILVDLHKMTDGCQDAAFMVAYLPQPKSGETFADKVDAEWIYSRYEVRGTRCENTSDEDVKITPFAYANAVFDRIEYIVSRNSDYVAIAKTPEELWENKHLGKKSIVLGIENALALEHDVTNIAHFKQRGISYITLCHNGDNDVCDSNRGENIWGGVSPFGADVIKEMNRQGIMVDLSHASEKSFYDALDISDKPIVCSHSNCRALCDHPRNLTDDQLRAIARKGGVVHITLYPGFLCKDGKASILNAMQHLRHAIDIMGIEHVGLGTDFDGDGGICGLRDSSEMLCFTRHLLLERYSEADIEKIWGGNWLRVMKICS